MIPVSTLFIGLNGLTALVLTYLVVMERSRTRLWHGESEQDIASQPDYLDNPNAWAATVERTLQKAMGAKATDDGVLQRKVRAYGNFAEFVPLALLLIVALEVMQAPVWLLLLLGSVLTIARIAHAWGLIHVYGPSIGRAIGFFGTCFVYIVGSLECIYYGLKGIF